MTDRDVLEEGRNTDAYWGGYLSEALRGLLAGRSSEEYAADALAKYDRWLEAEKAQLTQLRLEREAVPD